MKILQETPRAEEYIAPRVVAQRSAIKFFQKYGFDFTCPESISLTRK